MWAAVGGYAAFKGESWPSPPARESVYQRCSGLAQLRKRPKGPAKQQESRQPMQQPKLALPAFSTMSQVSSVLEALWNNCTSAKKWLPSVRHCSKSSAHSASASSCVPCTGQTSQVVSCCCCCRHASQVWWTVPFLSKRAHTYTLSLTLTPPHTLRVASNLRSCRLSTRPGLAYMRASGNFSFHCGMDMLWILLGLRM